MSQKNSKKLRKLAENMYNNLSAVEQKAFTQREVYQEVKRVERSNGTTRAH